MSETRDFGGNLQALDTRIKERNLDQQFKVSYSFHKTLEENNLKHLLEWIKLAFVTAKADYIFVDDYVPFFKYVNVHPKTKLIQVWHAGVGFKAVGYARFGENGSPWCYASCHRKYDQVIVGGEALRDVYAEVFGIDKEKCLPYGVMRDDNYLDPTTIASFKESFYQEHPELEDKKIILFAPTFRGNGQRDAFYPFDVIDQKKIYEMCQDEYVFLIKMHPFVRDKMVIDDEYKDRIIDFSDYPDINSLFYVTDILITDYSSNIYEFALLERPIVFFVFDKEEYELTRTMQRSLDEFACGKLCKTMDELVDTIEKKDFQMEKLDKFLEENYSSSDELATDQVIDHILLNKENG